MSFEQGQLLTLQLNTPFIIKACSPKPMRGELVCNLAPFLKALDLLQPFARQSLIQDRSLTRNWLPHPNSRPPRDHGP